MDSRDGLLSFARSPSGDLKATLSRRREANPESAVRRAHTRAWRGAAQSGELPAQCQVLEGEFGTGPEGAAKAAE